MNINYKIGDTYIELCKRFAGFDANGNVLTATGERYWTVLSIDETGMLCCSGPDYKVFEINKN